MKSGRQNGSKLPRGGKGGRRGDGPVGNTSQLPSDKAPVGDKSSNAMAKEVSALVAANQLLALGPSSIVRNVIDIFNASTTIGYTLARALVKKLMMAIPMDCTATDSTSQWSPAGATMYLVWAAFTSLRKSGAFTNAAMVNAFPDFPEECMIPVAWAQFLSYLKPFRGVMMTGQYSDTTFSALPTAPTLSGVGVGGNSFCVDSSDFSVRLFNAAAGAEPTLTAGTGTTWATLFGTVSFLSTVYSRGMNCVAFSKIPAYAPDASAYTFLLVQAQANRVLACFTPKFNPEVAIMYCNLVTANDQCTSHYAYTRPAPIAIGNHPFEFWWVENLQQCAFVPGANLKETLKTHEWNQVRFAGSKSRFGRVKVHGKGANGGKRKQPVRQLYGGSIMLDTRGYQVMIGQVLQMCGVALTNNQALGLAMVWMSALIAKVAPYCWATSQASCVPCGSFDPKFADAEMPLALAAVLNTIGPIAVDGRLRYPTLFSSNGVDLRGGWLRFSTVGNVSVTDVHWNKILGGANVTGVTLPLAGTAIYTFNSVNFATPTNAGATPLGATDLFLESVQATMGNSNANLVKPDSRNPVGKANLLVAADVTIPATANVGTVGTTLNSNAIVVGTLGSFKRIAGDELGVACVCPVVYPIDWSNSINSVAGSGFPFKAAGSGNQRTSNMIAFVQECSTGTVSNSIAQALGNRRRKTFEVGGNTVDISDNGDLFGAIVDGIVGPIFGDSASTFIKSGPLGAIGRAITAPIDPGRNISDMIGVVDGVVSSFGVAPDEVMKGAMMAAPFLV